MEGGYGGITDFLCESFKWLEHIFELRPGWLQDGMPIMIMGTFYLYTHIKYLL